VFKRLRSVTPKSLLLSSFSVLSVCPIWAYQQLRCSEYAIRANCSYLADQGSAATYRSCELL